MTRIQIAKLKNSLRTQLEGLKPSPALRDAITVETTADVLDAVRQASERELATRTLERESKLARELSAALRRIDHGTYGVCAECEEEISMKRLAAIPWAEMCIACQSRADGDIVFSLPRAA